MKGVLRKVLAVLTASGAALGLAALVLSGPAQAQTPDAQRSLLFTLGRARRDRCG